MSTKTRHHHKTRDWSAACRYDSDADAFRNALDAIAGQMPGIYASMNERIEAFGKAVPMFANAIAQRLTDQLMPNAYKLDFDMTEIP